MAPIKVETIEEIPRTILGEGPHWDIPRQSLYYIDMLKPNEPVYRYDYAEKKTYSAKILGTQGSPSVSFIIPVEDEQNQFVVSLSRQLGLIEWDGKSSEAKLIRILATVDEENGLEDNQMNDAKVDEQGRLYFGTWKFTPNFHEQALGSGYRYSKDGGIKKLFTGVYLSNGLTWILPKNKFYYIDSSKQNIMEYDHDAETGDISNGHVLIDFRTNGEIADFIPDGMTVDTEGFLYIAMYNGDKVVKVDPDTGKVILEIPIPVPKVTSVAFGGPNLDILYVTSSSWEVDENDKQPPPAGCIFTVTGDGIGVGLPMKNVRV